MENTTPERPEGVDEATVEAVGALTLAMETAIRARGTLYTFHQLTGDVDNQAIRAARMLREAGHAAAADLVEKELVGRNVNERRWTFQIVEDYDATYYERFVTRHREIQRSLIPGSPHQREAEMKQRETTPGEPGHGF